MVEGLRHAESVLTSPDEARDVVRVYCLRRHDVAGKIRDALLVFGGQRPQLAAREGPMVVSLGLRPKHALAQNVAVGLVVVGGDAGAQPVCLVVAAQSAPVGLALGHQCGARLAGAAKEFAQRIGIGALVWNRTESGGNVTAGSLGAVSRFTRQVASRCKGDALVTA